MRRGEHVIFELSATRHDAGIMVGKAAGAVQRWTALEGEIKSHMRTRVGHLERGILLVEASELCEKLVQTSGRLSWHESSVRPAPR